MANTRKTYDETNHQVLQGVSPLEGTDLRERIMALAVQLTAAKGGVDACAEAERMYQWVTEGRGEVPLTKDGFS